MLVAYESFVPGTGLWMCLGRGRAHRNVDCDQMESCIQNNIFGFKYHKPQFTDLKMLILVVK